MHSLPNQRSRFGIPREVVYYNCAYLSPLLDKVREAGETGLLRKSEPWLVKPDHFFDESDVLRRRFAELVHGEPEGVAIIPSASYGIGVAAANLPVQAGQNILVLSEQFPSNIYPWQALAKSTGAEIVTVDRPANHQWTDAVLAALNKQTAIAALPNCHWADGGLLDLATISEACRANGTALVLDVSQSLGALDIDVNVIKPAFLIAVGYKWLMGPYSLGYLYAGPEHRDGQAIEHNWIARKDSRRFSELVNYTDALETGAQRYDVGERSNFHLMPMAVAALEQLLEWGVPRITETLAAYNTQLIQELSDLGFSVAPDHLRARHILGVRYPGKLPTDLGTQLAERQIFLSIRGDAIRISPHLYNDVEDRARFIAALRECL